LFLSASGYVAAFSGVGARIDAQDITGPRVRSMVFTTVPMPPAVAGQIRRDPFAGAPNVPASTDVNASAPEPLPSDRGDVGGAVPNIAGAPADVAMNAAPAAAEVTLVVRATIVGKHSVAYVANGSEMDIVRVGDSLGDRRIVAIDLDGIAFSDGSRLDLVGSYEATPAPPARTNSIDLRIEQLRKLFERNYAVGSARVAATQPPSEAPQTEAPVTPAPLRTTDTTGLAPGSNPTPDLNDPTAYPYPYPYPAAHH
jgi:hypothetical protein